jgi:hypothetical protein
LHTAHAGTAVVTGTDPRTSDDGDSEEAQNRADNEQTDCPCLELRWREGLNREHDEEEDAGEERDDR